MSQDQPVDVPAPPPQRSSLAVGLILAVLLLLVGAGYWFWSSSGGAAAEAEAVKKLNELGALAVPGGTGKHIESVNLATITTPEALTEAIKLLPALSRLSALDASRTAIKDEDLKTVSELTGLINLSLNETAISDAGLAHLKPLTSLQALFLAATQVTDDGLAAVASLDDLRILDVSATKVKGNFEPLENLPQFEWLVLRECTLSDDALPKLAKCAAMTRLSLEDAKFSLESLSTLKKAKPQLGVNL